MKLFTWYVWTIESDNPTLSYYTKFLRSSRFANGFRFVKVEDEWRLYLSKSGTFNGNPDFNEETNISDYDIPKELFRNIMMTPFIDGIDYF